MVWAFAEDERTVKVKVEVKVKVKIEVKNEIKTEVEVEEQGTGLHVFIVVFSSITVINDIQIRSRVHYAHSSTRICTATW
jgi:hypothetical protein